MNYNNDLGFGGSIFTRAKRWFRNSYTAWGLAAGLVLGGITYTVSSAHYKEASINRQVHFTQISGEGSSEIHPVIRASAEISDTANLVASTYVRSYVDLISPTEVVDELKSLATRIPEARRTIREAQQAVSASAQSVPGVHRAGSLIRNSYTHHAKDKKVKRGDVRVYKNTKHTWTFFPSKAHQGRDDLETAIARFLQTHSQSVNTKQYEKDGLPKEDFLGRPIKDPKSYLQGQNEWLVDGIMESYNIISTPRLVAENTSVLKFLEQARDGLFDKSDFPPKVVKKNKCKKKRAGCDRFQAPAGYVLTSRVGDVTRSVGNSLQRVKGTLDRSAILLERMEGEIENTLTHISRNGFTPGTLDQLSDTSITLYKVLVPTSEITAPTSGTRDWAPVGFGSGALALCLLIGGTIQHLGSHRRYRGF